MAHTKGPWRPGKSNMNDPLERFIVRAEHVDGQPYICQVMESDYDKGNARLIAAAPDLLEALKVAINTVECASIGADGAELPWYRMARKAIAKAEGRP